MRERLELVEVFGEAALAPLLPPAEEEQPAADGRREEKQPSPKPPKVA